MDKSSPDLHWTHLPSYTIDDLLQSSEKYQQSHVEQNKTETSNEIEMMSQQSSDSRMEADSQESVGSRMEFSSQESDGWKMDLNVNEKNFARDVVAMHKTNTEIREKLENFEKELSSLGKRKRKSDSIQLGYKEQAERAKIMLLKAFELQEMALLARDQAAAMHEAVFNAKITSDQRNPKRSKL